MGCSSQRVLKAFVFIPVVQVKCIDVFSGDPDGVKDITSTFPGKIRVTDWWNTHFELFPVSLRRTQCRLKARGGYFFYQNYALWSIYHSLSCFNTWQWWFFSGPVHISPVPGSAALLTLWSSASKKLKGQGAD